MNSGKEILHLSTLDYIYATHAEDPIPFVLNFDTDLKISTKEDMILAANKLIKFGVSNVLIKGGHLKSNKLHDIFVNEKEIKVFSNKKIITKNTHGTGCTLSTAITSFFSCGKNLKKSCELGIKYVNSAILTNPKIGKGHGPINHLNSINLKKIFR